MTIDYNTWNEKLQHDINTEAAKISVFPFKKINKYEYLTCEENTTSWSKKCDIKSLDYLFSFQKSFGRTNKNDWRSKKNK